MVAFYTSRDPVVSDTLVRAATSAARHDEFAASLRRHDAAWDELGGSVTCARPATIRCNRRMGEARAAAREAGFRGAMFPWQSGSEGTEETQRVHLNPLSGRWEADLSHNQRHVNAAIFYNIWNYFQSRRSRGVLARVSHQPGDVVGDQPADGPAGVDAGSHLSGESSASGTRTRTLDISSRPWRARCPVCQEVTPAGRTGA